MSLLKRPPLLKMAPPGSHIVKRHARIAKDRITYFVKAHIRKNRGKKIVLLPENILYLYWQGAHFIPVVPGKFFYDYDKDGYEEIAISVWHGGQSIASSSAYVFSISGDSLIFKKKEDINFEFSRSVYEK